eukprot:s211_g22.t1
MVSACNDSRIRNCNRVAVVVAVVVVAPPALLLYAIAFPAASTPPLAAVLLLLLIPVLVLPLLLLLLLLLLLALLLLSLARAQDPKYCRTAVPNYNPVPHLVFASAAQSDPQFSLSGYSRGRPHQEMTGFREMKRPGLRHFLLTWIATLLFVLPTAFVAPTPSVQRRPQGRAGTALQALALEAPTEFQAPQPEGEGQLPKQLRKRVANLKREAIVACLAAMNDDTDAVELCARLSRKLSYVKAVLKRQMADSGVAFSEDLAVA